MCSCNADAITYLHGPPIRLVTRLDSLRTSKRLERPAHLELNRGCFNTEERVRGDPFSLARGLPRVQLLVKLQRFLLDPRVGLEVGVRVKERGS